MCLKEKTRGSFDYTLDWGGGYLYEALSTHNSVCVAVLSCAPTPTPGNVCLPACWLVIVWATGTATLWPGQATMQCARCTCPHNTPPTNRHTPGTPRHNYIAHTHTQCCLCAWLLVYLLAGDMNVVCKGKHRSRVLRFYVAYLGLLILVRGKGC